MLLVVRERPVLNIADLSDWMARAGTQWDGVVSIGVLG